MKKPSASLRVSGTSMWPVLWSGDRLVVDESCSYALGDVVLIRRSGLPMAHRITAMRPGFVLTRGDASWKDDPWVSEDAVFGRVVAVRRLGVRLPLLPRPLARMASLVTTRVFGPMYGHHARLRAWLDRS